MEIKDKIIECAEKIAKDKVLRELFMKEPVKALEKVLNVDLPDDVINQLIDGVKAKLALDSVADKFEGLKKLF